MEAVSMMDRPPWMWGVFFAIFLGVLVFDLNVLNRHDHVIKVRESVVMSFCYMLIALAFGAWVWYMEGMVSGSLFITGYLVELSLSMDNIFVISLVLTYFAVPRAIQHRVLFWGIMGVIVLRGLMIGAGTAIIANFQWILLLFALFLVFTGGKMLFMDDAEDDHDLSKNAVVKFFTKRMRVTPEFHGNHFAVRLRDANTGHWKWYFTPLMLTLCVVEVVDVIFAVDSIPAILSITQDPFIVYTSNLFAIMGLRALYFTLAAMLDRFQYLKYAISLVLVFIGVKVLADKGLNIAADWVEPYNKDVAETLSGAAFHISPGVSLVITVGTLVAGALFSVYKTRNGAGEEAPAEAAEEKVKTD